MSIDRQINKKEATELANVLKFMGFEPEVTNVDGWCVSVQTPDAIHVDFEYLADVEVFQQVLREAAIKQLED